MPDTEFYKYIFEIENIFIQWFSIVVIINGLANNIKTHLYNVPFTYSLPDLEYFLLLHF